MLSLSFIRIMVVVVLNSLWVVAQTQQPAAGTNKSGTPGSGTITGRVVNETGQPLPNAIVSVRMAGKSGSEQAAATDREGAFQVSGLEQSSSYYVSASLPAYARPQPEPGAANPTYRAGDSVTLTLIKGGVITGTVTSATGEPLIGILVRAQMVTRPRNGRRVPAGFSYERVTDDRGVYRLYGLHPGSYLVLAGGVGNRYSSANVDPYDTDVPTFAPSSTRDDAAEVSVRAGEETTGVEIRYRGEPGRFVSGVVTNATEGFNVSLTSVPDGAPLLGASSFPQMNGRSFSFIGIAEGDYDLYAYSYSQTRDYGVSEVKRIRVRDADVTGIELNTRPLASVAGRLVLEETKIPECTEKPRPVFNEMTVGAWHNDTEAAKEIPQSVWSMGAPVRPDAEGNFVVRNLAPGEYYFAPRLAAKNWHVRSIQFAGAKKPVDATRTWTNLKFGERLSGLAITLTPGGASFHGQLVMDQGEQVPARTFVYLAPVERERADNVLSYLGTPVTSEGKFAMNNIAPGRYWIFAQTVSEDAPVPLARFRFPHETETRAQIRREAEAAKTEIEFKPCQDVVDFKLPLAPARL